MVMGMWGPTCGKQGVDRYTAVGDGLGRLGVLMLMLCNVCELLGGDRVGAGMDAGIVVGDCGHVWHHWW